MHFNVAGIRNRQAEYTPLDNVLHGQQSQPELSIVSDQEPAIAFAPHEADDIYSGLDQALVEIEVDGGFDAHKNRYGSDPSKCPYIASMGAAGIKLVERIQQAQEDPKRGKTIAQLLAEKNVTPEPEIRASSKVERNKKPDSPTPIKDRNISLSIDEPQIVQTNRQTRPEPTVPAIAVELPKNEDNQEKTTSVFRPIGIEEALEYVKKTPPSPPVEVQTSLSTKEVRIKSKISQPNKLSNQTAVRKSKIIFTPEKQNPRTVKKGLTIKDAKPEIYLSELEYVPQNIEKEQVIVSIVKPELVQASSSEFYADVVIRPVLHVASIPRITEFNGDDTSTDSFESIIITEPLSVVPDSSVEEHDSVLSPEKVVDFISGSEPQQTETFKEMLDEWLELRPIGQFDTAMENSAQESIEANQSTQKKYVELENKKPEMLETTNAIEVSLKTKIFKKLEEITQVCYVIDVRIIDGIAPKDSSAKELEKLCVQLFELLGFEPYEISAETIVQTITKLQTITPKHASNLSLERPKEDATKEHKIAMVLALQAHFMQASLRNLGRLAVLSKYIIDSMSTSIFGESNPVI